MTSVKVTEIKARLRQAASLLRSAVWILDGMETHSGQRLRILFAGSEKQKAHFRAMAFADDCTETAHGKLYIGRILYMLRFNRPECDIVVIEGSDLHARVYSSTGDFLLPLWMKTSAALPLQSKSHSYKEDVRRIRKSQLGYQITTDDDSIEDFFHNMYRPTVNASHGQSTIEISHPHMKSLVRQNRCVLLQVMLDGSVIAGALITLGPLPRVWAIGIRDNNPAYRKFSANTATYYFAAQYLLEKGYRQMHLGMSRCFLDDGILQYKNKFGQRIIGCDSARLVIRILRDSPGTQGFLVNNPFVSLQGEELVGSVYLESDTETTDRVQARLRKKYLIPGISTLRIIQRSGSPGEFRCTTELS